MEHTDPTLSPLVLFDTDDDVVILTINREHKRNALTLDTWRQLADRVDEFTRAPDHKVAIIRGAGTDAFASGSDIDELPVIYADPDISVDYDRTLLAVQNQISKCPKPIIAMVFGFCVGGGLGIASACDLRFAAHNAQFALPPAKLGLINGVSSMHRLIQLIGLAATRDLIYSARRMDAAEALRLGLINRAVDVEELVEQTLAYAHEVAANSQYSIRVSKRLTREIGNGKSQDDEDYFQLVREAVSGEDFAEGFAAFKNKRKPKFPFR